MFTIPDNLSLGHFYFAETGHYQRWSLKGGGLVQKFDKMVKFAYYLPAFHTHRLSLVSEAGWQTQSFEVSYKDVRYLSLQETSIKSAKVH